MLKKSLILLITLLSNVFFAQEKNSLSIKNGIENPSLLSTHHFGIFNARINTNFKHSSTKNKNITFQYNSGNTFHPYVEAYFPKNPEVRKQLSNTTWFYRRFNFIDQETTPADYMNIVVDAVIKEFRLGFTMPLNNTQELSINLRSYLITKGKYPFSVLTSDETIEWFHSNIAGGEDPFGRRYYGLNQVNFKYLDRNGNTLKFDNNDFFISGLEFTHYFYPNLKINNSRNIYINFGSHLGINTSKYNPSVDFGISANIVKQYTISKKYPFNIAFGTNILRKNIVRFSNDAIDLGNNPFLATFEGNIEFTTFTKQKNYHAFGVNYQMQTRYNKKEETGYYKLNGKWAEINGGWHNGVSTLYRTLSTIAATYTYKRPNYKLSCYFKQDLEVNNAPDFQTGIQLSIPIKK
ncbi:hypothetical protein FUA26_13860 [Seonamhaeicola algicola]|uniref:Porin n=1 Tax=Seonamhaeicola algicola TaxID=1719036 RepID=A0A5C7AF16_9FLAO|nr:hypothetical protein [Seonamhaeicola algicola]TXE06063.1 hypothetical protein FUA26_13860 [Seonamhaeicola algicola]